MSKSILLFFLIHKCSYAELDLVLRCVWPQQSPVVTTETQTTVLNQDNNHSRA